MGYQPTFGSAAHALPPTPAPSGAGRNRILLALTPQERARLLAGLQPVTFSLGDVLCEAGARMEYVYFPTTCVISSVYTTEEGATAEMCLVGNDGVASVSAFLGDDTASSTSVVVVAGDAYRMKASTLHREFAAGGALQSLLLRYTQALIAQISQTAVCNRLHGAEQRLCRWLLMCHDRTQTDDLHMTQELIANMLGGRRETVTVAAGRLQDAGLIRYSRGRMTIVDRKGLEEVGCECYLSVERSSRTGMAG